MKRPTVHWFFLRHAMPVLRADTSSHDWVLGDEGREASARLGEALSAERGVVRPSRIWSSPEPKALETARIIAAVVGAPTRVEPDLREHEAKNLPLLATETFKARVRSWLSSRGRTPLGSESWESLERRFDKVIRSGLDLGADSDGLAMVTHGRWMACGLPRYLATASAVDPVEFWSSLSLPDCVEVRVTLGEEDPSRARWELVPRRGPAHKRG